VSRRRHREIRGHALQRSFPQKQHEPTEARVTSGDIFTYGAGRSRCRARLSAFLPSGI